MRNIVIPHPNNELVVAMAAISHKRNEFLKVNIII